MAHGFADRTFDRVSSGGVSSNWFSSCFLVNWNERLLRLWIRRFGSSCTKINEIQYLLVMRYICILLSVFLPFK